MLLLVGKVRPPSQRCFIAGRYDGGHIIVVHWGMRDRRPAPAASWRPGLRRRLTLDLFDAHPELIIVAAAQEADDPALVPYWALGAERP